MVVDYLDQVGKNVLSNYMLIDVWTKITLPLALSVVCGVESIDESSKGSSDESPDESSISSPDDSKNYMTSDEKFEWFIL